MVNAKKAMLHVFHERSYVGDISYDLGTQKFGLNYSPEWVRSGFELDLRVYPGF